MMVRNPRLQGGRGRLILILYVCNSFFIQPFWTFVLQSARWEPVTWYILPQPKTEPVQRGPGLIGGFTLLGESPMAYIPEPPLEKCMVSTPSTILIEVPGQKLAQTISMNVFRLICFFSWACQLARRR